MVNTVSDKTKSLKSLYAVRDLIAPLANINFFIELGGSAINYDDAQLASIIKADNYNKALQKVATFAQQQEEKVERSRQFALERQAEFEEAQRIANSNRPGSEPGSYVNRDDPNAVARYRQEAAEYSSRIDLHRRLVDKATTAGSPAYMGQMG